MFWVVKQERGSLISCQLISLFGMVLGLIFLLLILLVWFSFKKVKKWHKASQKTGENSKQKTEEKAKKIKNVGTSEAYE